MLQKLAKKLKKKIYFLLFCCIKKSENAQKIRKLKTFKFHGRTLIDLKLIINLYRNVFCIQNLLKTEKILKWSIILSYY